MNSIDTLQAQFPQQLFRKVSAMVERKYAEEVNVLYKKLTLLYFLQIKLKYFDKGKAKSMKYAKDCNVKKQMDYIIRYGTIADFITSRVDEVFSTQKCGTSLLNK